MRKFQKKKVQREATIIELIGFTVKKKGTRNVTFLLWP